MSKVTCRIQAFAIAGLFTALLLPASVQAQENHDSPRRQGELRTQLSNGAVATTNAQTDPSGLRVSTDVPIPVPGVYETRTELVQGNLGSPGRTIPGTVT